MKRKIFSLFLISFLFLSSTNAHAGHSSGNYINSDGCLVVWEKYTLFGITWKKNEEVFCNDDGKPIVLDKAENTISESSSSSFWDFNWF